MGCCTALALLPWLHYKTHAYQSGQSTSACVVMLESSGQVHVMHTITSCAWNVVDFGTLLYDVCEMAWPRGVHHC